MGLEEAAEAELAAAVMLRVRLTVELIFVLAWWAEFAHQVSPRSLYQGVASVCAQVEVMT